MAIDPKRNKFSLTLVTGITKNLSTGIDPTAGNIEPFYDNKIENTMALGGEIVPVEKGTGKMTLKVKYTYGSKNEEFLRNLHEVGTHEQKKFISASATLSTGETHSMRDVTLVDCQAGLEGASSTFTFEGVPREDMVAIKQAKILKGMAGL